MVNFHLNLKWLMQYEFLKKVVLFIKQIKSITITIKGLRKDSSPKTELNF